MTEPYLAHENQELHWTVMATASASARFICGTQEEHKQREERISSFLRMEDTILYSSCFESPALALCQQRYDGARGRIDEDRKLRLDPGPAEDHNKLGFTFLPCSLYPSLPGRRNKTAVAVAVRAALYISTQEHLASHDGPARACAANS